MRKLFISTGGFKDLTPTQAIKKLNKNNIFNIELSGGKYEKNVGNKILRINNKNNIRTHNYFLYPKKNFVINLASENKLIVKKSINLIKKNILFAKKINSQYVSFHAGFRFDIKPNKLGKSIDKEKLITEKVALKNFKKNLKNLIIFAKKNKIKILIENNVLSKKNYDNFKCNPFLLCSPNQIKSFFKKKIPNVFFLMDVAHYKVTCKTLRIDLVRSYKKILKFIDAYHLSDNNGYADTNSKISQRSWFMKNLKKNLNYFTLEVYTKNFNLLKKQVKLVEKVIND